MCIVNDYSVHIRYIHSTFNYVGGYQNVIFFINEVEYSFFQFMTFELPMSIPDTKVGTKPLDDTRHFRKTQNPVVYEEYLAPPFRFIVYRIPDKILVEHLDLCLNGLPVRWRSINN